MTGSPNLQCLFTERVALQKNSSMSSLNGRVVQLLTQAATDVNPYSIVLQPLMAISGGSKGSTKGGFLQKVIACSIWDTQLHDIANEFGVVATNI